MSFRQILQTISNTSKQQHIINLTNKLKQKVDIDKIKKVAAKTGDNKYTLYQISNSGLEDCTKCKYLREAVEFLNTEKYNGLNYKYRNGNNPWPTGTVCTAEVEW